MNIDWLSVSALIISLFSLYISYVSFRRTSMYQRYDYTSRIDFVDEKIEFGEYKVGEEFKYFAKIKNRGEKSLMVTNIVIEHGASHDYGKRIQYQIKGAFNILPSEECSFSFELPGQYIQKNIDEWGIQQYLFWLRLSYKTPEGTIKEFIRELGGYRREFPLIQLGNDETLK